MAVIDRNPHTMFDKFLEKLVEFPFIRVALFAAIATIVFFLIGAKIISNLFFYIIPQAIIGKILSYWLCGASYAITKFWATCLLVGIEFNIATTALRSLVSLGAAMETVLMVISGIGAIAIILAAIGFLIRIFIALFDR